MSVWDAKAGERLRAQRLGLDALKKSLSEGARKRPRYVAAMAKPQREKRLAPDAEPGTAASVGAGNSSIVPPADVLAERDRRYALAPASLTAAWQGDPLPGYSALDKRRGA